MKNREKYGEEIHETLAELFNSDTDGVCRFMKKQVFPSYNLKKCAKKGTCGGVTCIDCAKMFALWLDEEYIEPPKPEVDWGNVPVDTLVRVRDYEDKEWRLRYFKGIDNRHTDRFLVWGCGATSVTAEGHYTYWKYCELVEEELVEEELVEDEDGNSSI